MQANRYLLLAFFLVLALSGIIMGFNYSVDPLCFYCEKVDISVSTLNRHYKNAQMISAHPETEQVLIGSSRGETTSPLWMEEKSGLNTLNLSIAGAGIITKKAFINMALQKNHLKRVIWYADYFELTNAGSDGNILNTKALRPYTSRVFETSENPLKAKLDELQALIDHNTIEASFAAMKHKVDYGPGKGAGSDIDYKLCQSPEFKGKETTESLKHEVDLLYDSYVHGILSKPQPESAWTALKEIADELKARQVDMKLVVIPYHPVFLARLKAEYPDIYQAHLKWIERLKSMQGPGFEVINFFDGIPGGNDTPAYWNDGVHFTCKGVVNMLDKVL